MLDVLACRKDPAGVEGTLLVDGHEVPKHLKLMTGYVVQVSQGLDKYYK